MTQFNGKSCWRRREVRKTEGSVNLEVDRWGSSN